MGQNLQATWRILSPNGFLCQYCFRHFAGQGFWEVHAVISTFLCQAMISSISIRILKSLWDCARLLKPTNFGFIIFHSRQQDTPSIFRIIASTPGAAERVWQGAATDARGSGTNQHGCRTAGLGSREHFCVPPDSFLAAYQSVGRRNGTRTSAARIKSFITPLQSRDFALVGIPYICQIVRDFLWLSACRVVIALVDG